MIRIIETSKDKIVFKDYPTNYWLAFIFVFIIMIVFDYHILFLSPNSSFLICTKKFLNTTNCELLESSFFNKNLTHKTIKDVKEPRITFGGRVGKIWLKTEIDLWHGSIKNVYYPSSSILGLRLYNINQQVRQDIDKLNNFIQSWNIEKTLTIQRPIRSKDKQLSFIFDILGFLLLSLIFVFSLVFPIVAIFIYPIITYSFDLQKNILIIQELIFFSANETNYSLDRLVIFSLIEAREEKKSSISIKIGREKTYNIVDFKDKAEALNLLNLLESFVPIENIK